MDLRFAARQLKIRHYYKMNRLSLINAVREAFHGSVCDLYEQAFVIPLEKLSFRELRKLCHSYKIKYYTKLNRRALIKSINEYRQAKNLTFTFSMNSTPTPDPTPTPAPTPTHTDEIVDTMVCGEPSASPSPPLSPSPYVCPPSLETDLINDFYFEGDFCPPPPPLTQFLSEYVFSPSYICPNSP